MGRIISVSCRNKDCKYQSILYEGAGMVGCCKNEGSMSIVGVTRKQEKQKQATATKLLPVVD